jgi:hypothetical protein
MRFKDNNNKSYVASTKKDLATELWLTSFAKAYAENVDEWCAQCASRIFEQHGINLVYTDCKDFIDELIKYEFIKEIN